MKWVTRERARVDRIACPWLISRFVDRDAVFLFVPGDQVMAVAKRENAIPYDVPGSELGRRRRFLPSPWTLPLPRCQELFSRMPFVPIVKLARSTRARELAC